MICSKKQTSTSGIYNKQIKYTKIALSSLDCSLQEKPIAEKEQTQEEDGS